MASWALKFPARRIISSKGYDQDILGRNFFSGLSKMNDDDAIAALSTLYGIGPWSAEMFLIFNLCRPDIFPVDDLGLIKGICKCYNFKYPIAKDHALKLSKKWKPWRSVATWYFWRSLDPIPVEY